MGLHLGILVVSWGFLEAPRAHLAPSCELSKICKIMDLVLEFQELKIIISFFYIFTVVDGPRSPGWE